MKKCIFCAEEIQDAAVKCKHCGSMLSETILPRGDESGDAVRNGDAVAELRTNASPEKPSEGTLLARGLGISFLLIAGAFVLATVFPQKSTKPAAVVIGPARAAPQSPKPQLALLSATASRSSGYYIIEGQVRNISDQPLKNVTAVGSWSDKNGGFVTSDDALIDYNPILPGQTSPFKTMSTANPAMSGYIVEFKILLGGTLAVEDQRKK